MPTIIIKSSDPATGNLVLDPSDTVRVRRRETIQWTLGRDCGVKLISNIFPNSKCVNSMMWQEGPHRIKATDNWKAVVGNNSSDYSEYCYTITWVPVGSDDIKTFDPKISVIPPGGGFTLALQKVLLILVSIFTLYGIFSVFKKDKK